MDSSKIGSIRCAVSFPVVRSRLHVTPCLTFHCTHPVPSWWVRWWQWALLGWRWETVTR
jgi:hypothetical protein